MGISSDVSTAAVDRRKTVEVSVKVNSLDGRGAVTVPSKVDGLFSEVECS